MLILEWRDDRLKCLTGSHGLSLCLDHFLTLAGDFTAKNHLMLVWYPLRGHLVLALLEGLSLRWLTIQSVVREDGRLLVWERSTEEELLSIVLLPNYTGTWWITVDICRFVETLILHVLFGFCLRNLAKRCDIWRILPGLERWLLNKLLLDTAELLKDFILSLKSLLIYLTVWHLLCFHLLGRTSLNFIKLHLVKKTWFLWHILARWRRYFLRQPKWLLLGSWAVMAVIGGLLGLSVRHMLDTCDGVLEPWDGLEWLLPLYN